MARISPLMILPPVLFAAIAGMFLWGMNRENPDALPYTRTGEPAASLNLEPLGDFKPFGRDVLLQPGVKLVNIWASWCAPCRIEHPNLVKMAADGITIYGINYKDDPDKALAFLAELGNPFKQLGADPSGRNGIEWGAYGVPETFVIDSKGIVRLRFAGPITQRVYQNTILPAIRAAK